MPNLIQIHEILLTILVATNTPKGEGMKCRTAISTVANTVHSIVLLHFGYFSGQSTLHFENRVCSILELY